MEPITRQEIFLASAAGESTQELKPITRLEHFLKNVADHVKSIGNGGGTGGGGGASIDVTAQVGQTIVVKEVDANGKPTAWESADYQPRTHWSEPVEVLPETTVEIDPESGMGLIDVVPNMTAGLFYNVTYNGVEYNLECFPTDDEVGGFVLGNIGVTSEPPIDNGIPFVFLYAVLDWDENDNPIAGTAIMPLDGSTSVTLSIVEEKVTPISEKYLTNAMPYYIDINGTGTDEFPYSCDDTVENVESVIASGRTICARWRMHTEQGRLYCEKIFTFFLRVMEVEGGYTLYFITSGLSNSVYFDQASLTPDGSGTYKVKIIEGIGTPN